MAVAAMASASIQAISLSSSSSSRFQSSLFTAAPRIVVRTSQPAISDPTLNCLDLLRRRRCSGGRRSWTLHGITAEHYGQREPMDPPFNVLITGSTKGIGFALTREFLKAGDKVIICSRSAERVESAVENLRKEFGEQHVEPSVM